MSRKGTRRSNHPPETLEELRLRVNEERCRDLIEKAQAIGLPPAVPDRDVMQLREAVLKIVNANIAAFEELKRTLTAGEARLLETLWSIVDDTIRDRRAAERGDLRPDELREIFRQTVRDSVEAQGWAIEVLREMGKLPGANLGGN